MGYKEDLIESVETCLGTIQNGGHHTDPVVSSMAGRVSSVNRTLASARGLDEHEIIGVLTGMQKESASLLSIYVKRVAELEREKFDRREGWFRVLEIALLLISTTTAGVAAYRSISIGEKSIAISERQSDIADDQLKIQRTQAASETRFDFKIQEVETQLNALKAFKHSR